MEKFKSFLSYMGGVVVTFYILFIPDFYGFSTAASIIYTLTICSIVVFIVYVIVHWMNEDE
jgi:hypothetical protein